MPLPLLRAKVVTVLLQPLVPGPRVVVGGLLVEVLPVLLQGLRLLDDHHVEGNSLVFGCLVDVLSVCSLVQTLSWPFTLSSFVLCFRKRKVSVALCMRLTFCVSR